MNVCTHTVPDMHNNCLQTVERSISVCTILAAVYGQDSVESHFDMKVGL